MPRRFHGFNGPSSLIIGATRISSEWADTFAFLATSVECVPLLSLRARLAAPTHESRRTSDYAAPSAPWLLLAGRSIGAIRKRAIPRLLKITKRK
jgi:hypothetical protein